MYHQKCWAHRKNSNIFPWAAAKLFQSCPTLCDPTDGSPLGSLVPGILQARTLKWVAMSFSNAWKWKVKVKLLSRVWLFATPWTAAHQAPLSILPINPYPWHYYLPVCSVVSDLGYLGIWSGLGCKGRRQWHPTPVLLPGKSHGRRSLVGCSPWGR